MDPDATQLPLQGSTQKDAEVGQKMIVELPSNDAEIIQEIIFGLPPTDVKVDQEPTQGLISSDAAVAQMPIPGSTTQDAEVSQMPPPGLTLTDIVIDIEPSLEQITFGSDTLPTSLSHPSSLSPNSIPGSSKSTRTPQTQIPPSAVLIELDSDDDHNDPGQPQNGSKRKTFVDLTIDEEVTPHKCPSKGNLPPRTLRPKRKIPTPKQDDKSIAPNFARPKRARPKKQVPRTGRRKKSNPSSSFSSSCDDSLFQEDDPTWAPDSPRMDPRPKCRGRLKAQSKAGARKRQPPDGSPPVVRETGQTALPTVERHLLPPPLRTISNKKIDVEALDGVEYTEDLGYVFWDEDDTTKHLNAASQLLKHHFAKIAQLLTERDVNFENVDTAVWRLSATPYVLKTKKPKKPKGEQPFQWKPPIEETSEGPRLGRAEKKKIETLVAKGKPSRALKELSKVIHPVPEIPFEDMAQTIQALHNADDPRQLTLQDLGGPREGWDLERENVEIQLQRLNSNSTASLDGITAELLKRSATHLKPVSALIGAVIAECLQKGFVPTAWCLVRMVGIPKAKGGVRPISVQHSLKKLMARVLLQRNRQWFLDRIHPRQRGVGHPNGIEEIDFAVGDALDGAIAQKTNLVVAALDMSNAYQCVRRQLLIDKIVQLDHHDPQLVQFLAQAFSKEKLCINVRPLHLLRTLPISGHVLRQADDLLITHLLTFFHLPQSNSILIHANVEDGGLGFSSFAGSNIPSLVHAMTSRRPFLWQANPNPSGAPFQLGQEPPSSTFSPFRWSFQSSAC
ncbi:hypothetical protein BLNAU_22018 [Blattamonas nauphoetae]|uniref:Reverse transcriptase domain-containing protein n=1 Tax=Blattamonas nauphoetae TaxID=2049346 RepID=A0ABQ9WYJ3_9EUKA|nr:hypothetical protein BLNAU_22018 [Blattamonas nauphoetae]